MTTEEKPDVQPETKAKTDSAVKTLSDIDNEMSAVQNQIDTLTKKMLTLSGQRRVLRRRTSGGNSATEDTKARIAYVKGQAQIRAKRAADGRKLVQLIGEENLDPRAAIDKAMGRKNERGTARPVRTKE